MRTSRMVGAVLVAALLVLAGCGDDSPEADKDAGARSAPPPTRASSGVSPPTGANPEDSTIPPRVTPEERSHPWWKPVTSYRGDTSTTAGPFEIEAGAVQWRVTWKCQGAEFTAVPVKEPGGPQRPLASKASCSAPTGSGFGSQAGRYSLQITASGPWEVTVEQQVDHPLIEPPMPEMAQGKVVSTASLYDVDRKTRGTAQVFQLPDGRRAIRLESFFVTANVDLEIRLSELSAPRSTAEAVSAPFALVTVLKATVGSMNYLIPPEVDVARYRSLVIWCEITRNAYGAGSLQA